MNVRTFCIYLHLLTDLLAHSFGLNTRKSFSAPQLTRSHNNENWNHYAFERQGHAIVALNYGHVFLACNMTELDAYFEIARNLKSVILMATQKYPNNNDLKCLYDLVDDRMTLLEERYHDVTKFYSRYTSTDRKPSKSRVKRFIGALIAGIIGLATGATMYGLLDQTKIDLLASNINNLGFRQDKMIHLLEAQDKNIRMNRDSIGRISHVLVKVTETLSAQQLTLDMAVLTLYCNHLLDHVDEKLGLFVNAAREGSKHRLAHGLLSYDDAVKALHQIAVMAKSKNYELIVRDPHYIYQMEVSVVFDENGFHLILHVPLTRADQVLALFRYKPFPIELSPNLIAEVHPANDVIAIEEVGRKYFEMSHTDLRMCSKIHSYFVCPRINFLAKESHPSCILALFKADHKAALKVCKMTIKEPADTVMMTGLNSYAAFTKNPQTYQILCHNGTTKTLQLFHFHHFDISPECRVELPEFTLYGAVSLETTSEIVTYRWNLPLYNLTHNLNLHDAEEVLSKLEKEFLPPTDASALALYKSKFTPISTWSTALLVALVLGSIGLIGVVIVVCFACKNHAQNRGFQLQIFGTKAEKVPLNNGNE